MVNPLVYERPGEPRELAIWDKPRTFHSKGDPFVFCLRASNHGTLRVEATYAGTNVSGVMSEQARQGNLRPNDVFVAHDSLVYTCCDVTLTKRREHRPELCEIAINAAAAARHELERDLAPPSFDWVRHGLTPAYSEEKLKVGSEVQLHRDNLGQVVATPVDRRFESSFWPVQRGVVVARDSEDGQLLTTGRITATTKTYAEAELKAVEVTNRLWREQARAEALERSR